MYYEDYIREKAEQAFDIEKADFSVFDQDQEKVLGVLQEKLNEQTFKGVMCEMVAYLYERRNELQSDGSMSLLFDPENVENIYISARGLEAPTVIVEYDETPEWFEMENAPLREFYWHPKPALSGEWSAAYFQPR